jgi:hypothetical protein
MYSSTFKVRYREKVLWNPITAFSDDVNLTTANIPDLIEAPPLRDAVLLTVPFHLDQVVHPKVPPAISAKKAWTNIQRQLISSGRAAAVRSKMDFNKEVNVFSIPFMCGFNTVADDNNRWLKFSRTVLLLQVISFT